MEIEVGSILTGKVSGITKFGAFVLLAPGKSGLVHISEIANTYVNDVSEFLSVGQEVAVKVIGIDGSGRINLSIKQTQEPPAKTAQRQARPAYRRPEGEEKTAQPQDASFEDKLKRFMQDSDSKMSGIRQFAEKKSSRRRRG